MTAKIAILMPGDMGHGVGQALIATGHDAFTCLTGRSDHTRRLAARAGLRDVGFSEAETDGILGENWLRFWEAGMVPA